MSGDLLESDLSSDLKAVFVSPGKYAYNVEEGLLLLGIHAGPLALGQDEYSVEELGGGGNP